MKGYSIPLGVEFGIYVGVIWVSTHPLINESGNLIH
jgi:hypothetical protein